MLTMTTCYTAYTYEPFDDGAWGAALATATITSGDGLTPYETTTRADFHPGAFDLPGTVTRCGSSTASADCVTTCVVWDHGDNLFYGVPKTQTFIDGTTEETVVDPTCGVVTSTTDRAGRVRTRTLDSLCRVVSESFEGALTTTAYDSFNRVTLTTTTPTRTTATAPTRSPSSTSTKTTSPTTTRPPSRAAGGLSSST
jgi:hypothetical protein